MTTESHPVLTRAEALRRTKDPASDLSALERTILRWQLHDYGDFYTALWEALVRADEDNLARIELGFPLEVSALHAWRKTWIAESLRQKGFPV
jgi:hypothetical protein